jgi:putative colanic acid biosysnthesis UDP-glucose lipid carrier transferase
VRFAESPRTYGPAPTAPDATRQVTNDVAIVLKRAMDVVLAAVGLVVLSPVFLLVALIIKVDSPGPVLYRQARNGLHGEVFSLIKFRTLRVETCDPPEGQFRQVTHDDPRVTRAGRFLRWTSLDELPQLINVLRGEMSIVGPRPHPVALNEHYVERIDGYRRRHGVRPGITGWAQVNGLRGETETLDKMERRVRHDLHYVDNWSLGLDIRIIFRTLQFGFIDRGA